MSENGKAHLNLVNGCLEIPRAEGFTVKVFLAFPVYLGMEKPWQRVIDPVVERQVSVPTYEVAQEVFINSDEAGVS